MILPDMDCTTTYHLDESTFRESRECTWADVLTDPSGQIIARVMFSIKIEEADEEQPPLPKSPVHGEHRDLPTGLNTPSRDSGLIDKKPPQKSSRRTRHVW